jgi:effector-binding domain-containing protein
MKKILIAILLLLLAGLMAIYVLIPSNIKVSKVLAINCSINAGTRFIMDTTQWTKWWPTQDTNQQLDHQKLEWKQASHQADKALFNGFGIQTNFKEHSIQGELIFAQLGLDSMAVFWNYQLTSGWNPINRVTDYLFMKDLKEVITDPLKGLQTFLESKEKVYGMQIVHDFVKDTILVSTKKMLSRKPSQETVVAMIQELKNYAQTTGAKQTGFPMLNVTVLDSTHFQTMVALPVDKQIPETAIFSWKRMVAGKILIGEIKGGSDKAEAAMKQMQLYVQDYHITSPAIPFYSFVTDRAIEKDSTKWITQIYYPVM